MKRASVVFGRFIRFVLVVVLLGYAIYGVTLALQPRIPDFYAEDEWDVVFYGTSQAYCTFDPSVFDEYGMKTYVRARQQMPINYTYYYIKDAFEVSSIDVVVLEILGVAYGYDGTPWEFDDVRESAFNDFRYSKTKLEAIHECIPKDKRWPYYFPLDKYHGRWEQLDYSSWDNFWKSVSNPYYTESSDRGFWGWDTYVPCEYASMETIYDETRLEVSDVNMQYLDRIYGLCQENGAELVLVKSPLPYSDKIVAMTNTVMDWAYAHDVEFINYMKLTDEIGLDFDTDVLDGKDHLNKYGAAKVSRHLAEYLREKEGSNLQ